MTLSRRSDADRTKVEVRWVTTVTSAIPSLPAPRFTQRGPSPRQGGQQVEHLPDLAASRHWIGARWDPGSPAKDLSIALGDKQQVEAKRVTKVGPEVVREDVSAPLLVGK